MPAKLYDLELSGNCYKVRLLAAMLGVPLELVPVDTRTGEQKKKPVIELNPFGQIPVFVEGDLVLRDSQAILVYLARKYGGETWLPTDPAGMAAVTTWLMVAENEMARGPADARVHDKFGRPLDIGKARAKAAEVLTILEDHLSRHQWLALGRPTIADIACMPYVALAHEGGVPLGEYPAVLAWIGRVKALPGFTPMPGI